MNLRINGSGHTGKKNPMGASGLEETNKFKSMFKKIGRFAVQAGKSIAPLIPGGDVLKIALEGISGKMNSESQLSGGMNPYDMLQIQQEMLQEARMFTLLSNIIKVRHDAAMNSIRNIR